MKSIAVKALALSLAILAGGCIGMVDRFGSGAEIHGLYQPTRECADLVSIPFRKRGAGAEEGIAKAFCTIVLPVTTIDLPFEVVFDTIFIPYDLCVSAGKAGK